MGKNLRTKTWRQMSLSVRLFLFVFALMLMEHQHALELFGGVVLFWCLTTHGRLLVSEHY